MISQQQFKLGLKSCGVQNSSKYGQSSLAKGDERHCDFPEIFGEGSKDFVAASEGNNLLEEVVESSASGISMGEIGNGSNAEPRNECHKTDSNYKHGVPLVRKEN